MEQRPQRKEIKKDMQGSTKLHHTTKEWTTRPDLKLEFNSCAPGVYAFPAPLVATIMLLIFIFQYQYLVEIYSVSAEKIISDAFSYSENV
jgi:hypothetical protein